MYIHFSDFQLVEETGSKSQKWSNNRFFFGGGEGVGGVGNEF